MLSKYKVLVLVFRNSVFRKLDNGAAWLRESKCCPRWSFLSLGAGCTSTIRSSSETSIWLMRGDKFGWHVSAGFPVRGCPFLFQFKYVVNCSKIANYKWSECTSSDYRLLLFFIFLNPRHKTQGIFSFTSGLMHGRSLLQWELEIISLELVQLHSSKAAVGVSQGSAPLTPLCKQKGIQWDWEIAEKYLSLDHFLLLVLWALCIYSWCYPNESFFPFLYFPPRNK